MQTMIKLRIVGSFVDLEVGGTVQRYGTGISISPEIVDIKPIPDKAIIDMMARTIDELKKTVNDPVARERMEREAMMSDNFGYIDTSTIQYAFMQLGDAFGELMHAIFAQIRNDINWIKDLVRREK